MKTNNLKTALVTLISLIGLFANAASISITSNTNWSAITTGSGLGGLPNASDNITVSSGRTLTVDILNATVGSIQLASASSSGTLLFNNSTSLVVSGNVAMGSAAANGTINMTAGGLLSVNSFSVSGNTGTAILTAGSGTIILNSSNTLPNSTNFDVFNNLTINNGTTTASRGLTISGALDISSGATFSYGGFALTESGTTTVYGTFDFTSTSGVKSFNNLILNSGSICNGAASETISISGLLTSNGGSSTGGLTFNITGNWLVNSSTTNSFGGSDFNVTGTSTINGIVNWQASSNTRNFNGSVTINSGGQWNSITATGATDNYSFAGNLIMNGGAIDGPIPNRFSISGNLIVNASTINSIDEARINCSGSALIDGTLNISSTSGSKSFKNITISSTGVWNCNVAEDFSCSGDWTNNGSFNSGSGRYTFSGNNHSFNGTSTSSFYDLRCSGNNRQNNTMLVATENFSITGGAFLQNTNSSLTIGNTSSGASRLDANSNVNSVIYNSSGSQTIMACNYHHLTVSNSGTTTLSSAISVNGDLLISGGILVLNADITGNATGSMSVSSGAQLDLGNTASSTNISFPSNFISANISLANGSIVRYQSNSASQIVSSVPTTYGYLEVSSNSVRTKAISSTPLTIANDLTLSSNLSLNAAIKTIDLSGNFQGAGVLSFSGAGTFNINGAWNNTGTFVKGTCTVNYNGSGSQTIAAQNYHNLSSSSHGARTLAASGIIGISGVFTPGPNAYTVTGSTVTFNGSSAQTVPAFTFYNQTISNSAGVSLAGNVDLQNTLTLSSGAFTTTGFTYTLLSNASLTGNIATIPGGASIVGNIKQQRYAPGGLTGWAWLGSPVTNATIADWQGEFATSGFTGATGPAGGFVSVYTYNEAASGTMNSAASYVAATNSTNTITNGKGYYVYLGTGSVNTNAITFDVTGTPKTGNVNFGITYNNFGSIGDDGWNLVANPYPSAINWMAASGWTKTNISNSVYYFNADINNYAVFSSSPLDSTNGASRFIPSSQGFMVKAIAAAPVLSCTESVKTSAQPNYFRVALNHVPMVNGLKIKINQTQSNFSDECSIKFFDLANNEMDEFDADKMYVPFTNNVNIATINSNRQLSINCFNQLTNAIYIPVYIKLPSNGNYTISYSGLLGIKEQYPEMFDNNYLVLEDISTGEVKSLNAEGSFDLAVNDGILERNYILRFNSKNVVSKLEKLEMFNTIEIKNNGGNWIGNFSLTNQKMAQIDIFNTMGSSVKPSDVFEIKDGTRNIDLSNLSSGVYIIRVSSGNTSVSKKVFIM